MAVGITNTANPTSAGTGTTISYNTVDIGAAAHDRVVVLCVGMESGTGAISSATINFGGGAVAMNASTNGATGAIGARVFWLQAPVGATADFAITFGASVAAAASQHIAVYRVTGAQGTASGSSGIGDTDADPISSGAITIPSNGGCVAVSAFAANATGRTWTGITEGLDTATGNFDFGTGTSVTSGTPTITVSGANNEDGALAWVLFAANASVERLPPQGNAALSPTAPSLLQHRAPVIARVDLVISPSQAAIGMSKDLNAVDLVLSTTAPTVASVLDIPISPPRVDLAITPTAPTSVLGVNAGPPRVDLVISPTAPTAAVVYHDTGISPARVDLVLSPSQAAIGTSKDLNAVDLVLSTTAPTVSTVLNTPISPARADLVISRTAPTVTAGAAPNISPAAANLTTASLAPDAGLGSDIPIAQLVISSTAPIVSHDAAPEVDFAPARVDLVISPSQPAIGMAKALNTVDLVISTTAPQPVVLSGLVIIPATVDLVISATAPTIAVVPSLEISPARVDLVISRTAPTVTESAGNNTTIIPDTRDLVISGSQPAIGLSKDITAADLVISTTAPSVSALLDIPRNPPRVDLAISATAPTVVLAIIVSPATIDLILSCTTPILVNTGVATTDTTIDVGGKARSGRKRSRTADDDLSDDELQYMFRKLAELKKAKSEREKQAAAKALEIALAQAANDDDAAEVISDTIEEAYGTPLGPLTDFSDVLRDIELLTAIVRNLEGLASESAKFARDEDDIEALMLAL